jgi:hypothetical protein
MVARLNGAGLSGIASFSVSWLFPGKYALILLRINQTGTRRKRMNMNMYAVIFMTALLASGCCRKRIEKKVEEEVGEKLVEGIMEEATKGKVEVDSSKGKLEIKTEEGQVSLSGGKDLKVPDDFPGDVYIYDDARVTAVFNKDREYILTYEIDEGVEKVAKTYKKKMVSDGWKEKMALTTGQGGMLAYEKKGRVVSVTIGESGKKTAVSLAVKSK